MITQYMNAIEERLISDFKASKGFSHSVNQGSIREHFIRDFLNGHFNETFSFGTGEIIDANSKPGEKRNQFDIVLYNKNYPRLSIGGITAFLAESVVATIEIKSTFKEEHLISAIEAAQKTKEFDPDWRNTMSSGYIPPKIINYLVAYQCDIKNMSTIFGWIKKFYKRAEISDKDTFLYGCTPREKIACKVLDGIFILQKGFILFDNVPLPFIINKVQTKQHPGWVISESKHGNLATLFHHLLTATSNIQIKCLNSHSYFKDFQPEIIAHTI